MNADTDIRVAGPDDSADIAAFLAAAMPDEWRVTGVPEAAQLRAALEMPQALMILARRNGAVVGLAQGWVLPTVMGTGDTVMLDEFLVAPAHQRQGIGSALVTAFIAAARQSAKRPLQIWATTDTPKEPAARAFDRAGAVRGDLIRQFDWPMECRR